MIMKTYIVLPRSMRKFIRREKSRLRRSVSDTVEAEKQVLEMMGAVRKAYGAQSEKKEAVVEVKPVAKTKAVTPKKKSPKSK